MSRTERMVRLGVLLTWLVYCEIHGGPRMVFYGFLTFGLLCVVWYTVIDTWHRLSGALSRPKTMIDARSVNVFPQDEQALRGVPVTDDFAGMITYRQNTKG